MRERPPSNAAKRNIRQLLRHGKKHGATYFNAAIMRVGFVPRTRRGEPERETGKPIRIEYPTAETHYMDSFGGRHQRAALWEIKQMKKAKKFSPEKRNARQQQMLRESHQRFPWNIGVSSILEVGNDGRGNPTHVLVLQRHPGVIEAPAFIDFPAGQILANQKPEERINKRVSAEVGVDPKEVQWIGPGLKPWTDKEPVMFALHRSGRMRNYNSIVIQRVSRDAEEVRKTVQAKIDEAKSKKDPWAAYDFALIPRNSAAIQMFLRSHDKTWMPEVLRLYSQELNRAQKPKK